MVSCALFLCLFGQAFGNMFDSLDFSEPENINLWMKYVYGPEADNVTHELMSMSTLNHSYAFIHSNTSNQHETAGFPLICQNYRQRNTSVNISSTVIQMNPSNFSFLSGKVSIRVQLPVAESLYSRIELWPLRCASVVCNVTTTTIASFGLFHNFPNTMYYTMYYPGSTGMARTDVVTSQRSHSVPEPYYNIEVISTRENLSFMVNGTVVASFNNQLSLPKEPITLRFEHACSFRNNESLIPMNHSSTMNIFNITFEQFSQGENSSIQESPPELHWEQTYHNQTLPMRLLAYDNDVAVYFDEATIDDYKFERNWILNYIGQLWRYIKEQYDNTSTLARSRIFAAFHPGRNEGCDLSLQTVVFNSASQIRLVLDCGAQNVSYWNEPSLASKSAITVRMTFCVTTYAHGISGYPAELIDKGNSLMHLVVLDMSFILVLQELPSDMGKGISELRWQIFKENFSPSWYHWYYGLYHRYNGSKVVSRFFHIISENFPTELNSQGMRRYSRNMSNAGEYVHFWSGASGDDLRDLYKDSFGRWSLDEAKFSQAQRDFPRIRYTASKAYVLPSGVAEQNETGSGKGRTTFSTTTLALAVAVPVAVALVTGVTLFCYCRKRGIAFETRGLSQKMESSQPFQLLPRTLSQESYEPYGLLLSNEIRRYIVPRENLQQSSDVLGSGQYGIVYTAEAKGLFRRTGTVAVAAKVLACDNQENHESPNKLFEREVNVMLKAGRHLNIVNLLGIVLDEHPTLLLELCEFGCLLKYLRDCRSTKGRFVNLVNTDGSMVEVSSDSARLSTNSADAEDEKKISTTDLISFSYQISRGLDYLASRSIIHRDIAARNILITKFRVAKVADFGMARWSEVDYLTSNANQVHFPVRWMPPEALSSFTFSESTDIWSYGVLMWEVFSLGEVPYRDVIVSTSVKDFVKWLAAGNQLEHPQYCPNELYDVMKSCWNLNPLERPRFKELREVLENFTSRVTAGYYTQLSDYYRAFDSENEQATFSEPNDDPEVHQHDSQFISAPD